MSSVLSHLPDLDNRLMPFTVDQYHRMIKEGILMEGAPYELIGGYLVLKDRSAKGKNPMTVGHEHAYVISKLMTLNETLKQLGCSMRVQQPIPIPPSNEPEPDGAVVLGNEETFRTRHPKLKEVRCVMEVADSSLHFDRTTKLNLYAAAGIGQYLIINLLDRTVEMYARPLRGKYREKEIVQSTGKVIIPAAGNKTLAVSVRSILP